MSKCRRTSRSGFTLAEVLFALAIAGLVIAAVHELLASSFRWFDMLQQSEAHRGTAATLTGILERDLAGFYPLQGQEEPLLLSASPARGAGRMEFSFITTAQSLTPAQEQEPIARRVIYSVKPSADGSGTLSLLRGEAPYPGQEEGAVGSQVLTRGLSAFEAQVFDGEQWRTEWPPDDEEEAPQAVAVRAGFRLAAGEEGPVSVQKLLDSQGMRKVPLLRSPQRLREPRKGPRQ